MTIYVVALVSNRKIVRHIGITDCEQLNRSK
jgi:hypothetical protein